MRGSGKNHQAGNDPIQTMYCPNAGGGISQRIAHQLRHTAGFVGRKHSRGLDADGNGIICVENFDRVHGFTSYFADYSTVFLLLQECAKKPPYGFIGRFAYEGQTLGPPPKCWGIPVR